MLGTGRGFPAPLQRRGVTIPCPRGGWGLRLLGTTPCCHAGLRGINGHVGRHVPFSLTLMGPLSGLRGLASVEEPWQQARAVEDLKDKKKHTLFHFGKWQSMGGRYELEGTAHKVHVALGDKLNPSDGHVWLEVLSQHDKGH